jgi:glyoxylase-like metal-dependent hydrolase (beta-lactamase superfamily II)
MVKKLAEGLFCIVEKGSKTSRDHYSYFLVHSEGNLLFHPLKKSGLLKKQERLFAEHGGIKLQVLTHDAEASPSCEWINDRFGAAIYVHSSDFPRVTRKTRCPIAHAFSTGHQVVGGVDAIPLTGHTLGFTAYRVATPEVTFLITGDFLSPNADGWVARVRKPLTPIGVANLRTLKNISFDALLPNMSKGAGMPPSVLSTAERDRAIDGAISRLAKKCG